MTCDECGGSGACDPCDGYGCCPDPSSNAWDGPECAACEGTMRCAECFGQGEIPDGDRGVPGAVCERGHPFLLAILGKHLLVAGVPGAGKGSLMWGPLRGGAVVEEMEA